MAEWKYGTVIDSGSATVMLIGRSDGNYATTDHFHNVPEAGEWIGLTIVDKERSHDSPFGKPGDTTWVIAPITDWRVLDE